MSNSMTTRMSLLERARNGDGDEFARLYAPLAYSMARKCGLNEHDAQDVAQTTMAELLDQLPTFHYDRARGTFKGFIKKIVKARTYDLLRKSRRSSGDNNLETVADPNFDFGGDYDREWERALLNAALDRVALEVHPNTLNAFILTAMQGQSVDDVADLLGQTPNQVCQNKRRVIQRIIAHLEELRHETE